MSVFTYEKCKVHIGEDCECHECAFCQSSIGYYSLNCKYCGNCVNKQVK